MKTPPLGLVALAGIFLQILPASLQADPNAAAKFNVTNEVARPAEKVPPLGANNSGGRAIQYAVNNMFSNAGNEPIHWQNMHRATNIEGKSFELQGPSTSWYDLWYDGFLSGAKVRIYRLVDKEGRPLPLTSDQKLLDTTNADHVVLVGETHVLAPGEQGFKNGGWVVAEPPEGRKPKRVYLAADAPHLHFFDYIVLDKAFDTFDMNWVHPRVRAIKGPKDRPNWYWNANSPDVRFSLAPHPGKVPAEMFDPGKTCMKVEAVAGPNQISQLRFIGTDMAGESQYYGQFEPGRKYRMEAWMRQEGLANNGEVQFAMSRAVPGHEQIAAKLAVNAEWRKYTFDFVGPPRPAKSWHYGPAFNFTGPGTLWLDNARLFRYDKAEDLKAVYVPNRTVLEELLASQPASGRKGCHRTWVLSRDMTMDSILGLYPSSQIDVNWITKAGGQNADQTLANGLMFDYETGDSPQTRVVPHIVIQHIFHDEADWQHFVEYLAAPYNPASDTPQSKPWAYRRTLQRNGNGKPWVDEFREIIVEFGNETWHNGAFDDWVGFATYKAIHQGGAEYGLFSNYLIHALKKSQWWSQARLDDRVRFNLGGNYSGEVKANKIRGYGELAMQKCPQAQYLGHANYVGPKWETGGKPLEEFNDVGLMSTLLNFPSDVKPNQDKMAATRDHLKTTGINYDIIAYEGGPSGYAVDSRKDPKQAEISELYGKSQAMAVAALDAWLGSYLQGWTYQDYLGYSQGTKWSSHTMMSEGFRPHAGWLALTLRNRFASGDLMKVEELQGPKFTVAEKQPIAVPLVGVYAMRDGARWSVFVLSRKLNANVQGQDMGDGYNKVSLQLPFKSAAKVTLHKLAGDPRWNNRSEAKVKIESKELDARQLSPSGLWNVEAATGGGPGGMPPGAIFLYVFENAR